MRPRVDLKEVVRHPGAQRRSPSLRLLRHHWQSGLVAREVGWVGGLEMQSRTETMRQMAAMGHSVEGVGTVDGRMGKQRDLVTVGMEAEVVVGIVEMKH